MAVLVDGITHLDKKLTNLVDKENISEKVVCTRVWRFPKYPDEKISMHTGLS
jgi:hypothetical protein